MVTSDQILAPDQNLRPFSNAFLKATQSPILKFHSSGLLGPEIITIINCEGDSKIIRNLKVIFNPPVAYFRG